MEIDYRNKAVTKFCGFICAIVEDFSSALNYSFHMNMLLNSQKTWPEIPNHLYLFNGPLYYKRGMDSNQPYVVTRPVTYVENYITLPPGEPPGEPPGVQRLRKINFAI